jgi:hypothetical protein
MDLFHRYGSSLRATLDEQSRAFEVALKEELDRRRPSLYLCLFCYITLYAIIRFIADPWFAGELEHSLECEALRSELEALRPYPATLSRLEQENTALRSKLERAAKRKPLIPKDDNVQLPSSSASVPGSWRRDGHTSEREPLSLENPMNLTQENDSLRELLEAKKQQYASLMDKHIKMTQKLRKYKESNTGWQLWYERSVAKSQALKPVGSNLGQPELDTSLRPTPSVAAPLELPPSSDRPSPAQLQPSSHTTEVSLFFENPSGPANGQTAVRAAGKVLNSEHNPVTGHSDSSTQSLSPPLHSTEVAPVQKAGILQSLPDSDSDTPVFVGERSLKRKRTEKTSKFTSVTGPRYSEQWSTKLSAMRTTVKGEPGSSPILLTNARPSGLVHDSIDLDEVGHKSFTPTKGKRNPEIHPSQLDILPPRFDRGIPQPRYLSRQTDKGFDELKTADTSAMQPRISNLYNNPSNMPNRRVAQRSAEPELDSKNKPSKRRHGSGSDQIPLIAEDGDSFLPGPNGENDGSQGRPGLLTDGRCSETMRPDYYHRLDALLSGTATNKRPISPSAPPSLAPEVNRAKLERGSESAVKTKIEQKVAIASKRTGSPKVTGGLLRSHSRSSSLSHSHGIQAVNLTSVVSPNKERLRDRPLHRLQLDDFKINPSTNDGLDYAFHEVMRGRSRRNCLADCTKPDCCGGKFKKILEVGGVLPSLSRGLWEPAPGSKSDEEMRLLQKHTGLDSRTIGGLSKEEKEDLIVRINTTRFAKEYGKHKEGPARPPTPPGFWRAEMPTTQQAAADKEQAAERERAELEKRYKEAMSGGGRWIFKDE